MDNVEASVVALTVGDDTNTTHVTSTGDHADNTSVEVDEVGDLASGEVDLDGVVDLDGRVRVTDGAAVVGDEERNALVADSNLADLAEFVGSLLRSNTVDGETALDVVEETEVLARLLNRASPFSAAAIG